MPKTRKKSHKDLPIITLAFSFLVYLLSYSLATRAGNDNSDFMIEQENKRSELLKELSIEEQNAYKIGQYPEIDKADRKSKAKQVDESKRNKNRAVENKRTPAEKNRRPTAEKNRRPTAEKRDAINDPEGSLREKRFKIIDAMSPQERQLYRKSNKAEKIELLKQKQMELMDSESPELD